MGYDSGGAFDRVNPIRCLSQSALREVQKLWKRVEPVAIRCYNVRETNYYLG